MAKASNRGGGSARIRFIMVEAELSEGDIGQVTQAIQNALRPPVVQSRIANPAPTRAIAQEAVDLEPELDMEAEAAVPVEATSDIRAKPRAARKPPATPQVIDVDLISEPSLQSFADTAKPKSHLSRYLVIAAWFKDHRGVDAVTASHVYTCYRSLKWPLSIDDFNQPLRKLKAEKLFTQPEKGKYAINHLGLQRVQEMIAGGGEE